MSFWNNIFARSTATPLQAAISAEREARSAGVAVSTEETNPGLLAALGLGGYNIGGVTVNERTALAIAAVYACVNAISQDIAALPLGLYRKESGGSTQVSDHTSVRLLNLQANPMQNALGFRQTLLAATLLHGNGYARITFNSRQEPVALHFKHKHETQVFERDDRLWYKFNGDARTYADWEVLHLKGLSLNGKTGLSVLEYHRETIGQGLAAKRQSTAFYENGVRPSGVLSTDKEFKSDETGRKLAARFKELYGGAGNAGNVVVLEGGMKFQAVSLAPEDAQYIETAKLTREDVASIFRVPPHKIGDLSRSTNNNIEQQSIDYVTGTLTPWLVNIEQELKLKLLSAVEQRTSHYRHNLNGLLRGDTAARGAFYRVMTDIGAYSINEVRALEEANGIGDEGDVRYVQVNRQTLANSMLAKPAPANQPDPGTPAT